MEPPRRRIGGFFYFGQWTEIVCLYAKDRVELAAEIFQSDDRSQFHQFFVTEMFFKTLEKSIGDALARVRHPFGQLEGPPLTGGKQRTFLPVS